MNILNLQDSKLREKQNLLLQICNRFAESLYIFLATLDEVEKYVNMMQSSYSGNCVCHYNAKILNLFDPE